MNERTSRFDAPFWMILMGGLVLVGSLGFLGLAVAAQDASRSEVPPLAVGDS
ncbi:MAG: hypothetical protein JST00_41940 [Deltaproteobacteria bacterium]|nr:hypothetical protein [Deltaproteobacteria bacterium]